MNDFNLSRCYGPSMLDTSSRKVSRSDLVFQKLKKYEEKYKTNRNANCVLVETDSESDIEQCKAIIPNYTKSILQDFTTNSETSIHSLQKVETVAAIESLKNGNVTSSGERPYVASNNKSLIIDLQVVDGHFGNSDDSKTGLITNSFPSACQDRNCISPKKSLDPSEAAAGQNVTQKTMNSSLKTSVNNNLVESDTFNDLNNLHTHIMLQDYHTDPDSDHTTILTDNKILIDNNTMNESKNVDLHLTDEMNVEYSLKENKNESLKQIDCVPNGENSLEEPESIRTEIFQSNSAVTSYDVPDISYSYDMDTGEKSQSSDVDIGVTSKSSVTSGDDVCQNTDDKTVTVPASNNATDGPSSTVISARNKCNKNIRKKYKPQIDESHYYCKTKSTQTNINLNFLHHMNDIQLPTTTAEEEDVLSPYSLFVYHYLLHGYPQDHTKEDTDCAVSFLNKCLMEQVSITQDLINSHQATYNAHCTAARNLSKNYQPITLKNTMQYIRQKKKKQRNKIVSS